MNRAGKLAVAIMVVGAVASATIGLALTAEPAPVPARSDGQSRPRTTDRAMLDRCRTIVMPDSGCDAAWEAERRRFFRGTRP